ncbi:hypothetical protein PR048_029045 [Dryococelus australis]|uniref:Uncharacterized protein n=1 Tax=Dryococelus australis TaxID=614101 RepID=A0ABQ9GC92_9NEOP|nr:hypothetical protein PR048_029045 [Dryococelus australis]
MKQPHILQTLAAHARKMAPLTRIMLKYRSAINAWQPPCQPLAPGFVVRLLASLQGELGSVPGGVATGFSQVWIVPDDAAGRRVFSGISRFPRRCIPALLHTRLASPSSALETSLLRAAQISSLTHPIGWLAYWLRSALWSLIVSRVFCGLKLETRYGEMKEAGLQSPRDRTIGHGCWLRGHGVMAAILYDMTPKPFALSFLANGVILDLPFSLLRYHFIQSHALAFLFFSCSVIPIFLVLWHSFLYPFRLLYPLGFSRSPSSLMLKETGRTMREPQVIEWASATGTNARS